VKLISESLRSISQHLLATKGLSVCAKSVRDNRPATCDDVVEAMDEAVPGISVPLATEKVSDG
jgi:predicted ATPase